MVEIEKEKTAAEVAIEKEKTRQMELSATQDNNYVIFFLIPFFIFQVTQKLKLQS